MDEPAADGQPAGAAAGEERPGRLLGPGQRAGVATRKAVEEPPEQDHEADIRGQLEQDREAEPDRADMPDLAVNAAQARDRRQQGEGQRGEQSQRGELRDDLRPLLGERRHQCASAGAIPGSTSRALVPRSNSDPAITAPIAKIAAAQTNAVVSACTAACARSAWLTCAWAPVM